VISLSQNDIEKLVEQLNLKAAFCTFTISRRGSGDEDHIDAEFGGGGAICGVDPNEAMSLMCLHAARTVVPAIMAGIEGEKMMDGTRTREECIDKVFDTVRVYAMDMLDDISLKMKMLEVKDE
jgi:hypothetical protein